MKLETPDLGPLMAAGFKFPEPFTVKAGDGVTRLGVMYGVRLNWRRNTDHRLRLSWSADRRRDEELQSAQQQHLARAVRVRRHRGRQPRRPSAAVGGPTTTATATCATTASRTRRPPSSSSPPATRSSTSTKIDLGPLGRRLHVGGGDARVSRLLQGRLVVQSTARDIIQLVERSCTASRKSRRTARSPSSTTSRRTRNWPRT